MVKENTPFLVNDHKDPSDPVDNWTNNDKYIQAHSPISSWHVSLQILNTSLATYHSNIGPGEGCKKRDRIRPTTLRKAISRLDEPVNVHRSQSISWRHVTNQDLTRAKDFKDPTADSTNLEGNCCRSDMISAGPNYN
jgi:hypothetical protein